jgi:flagellar hook-length control protein FliK
MRIQIHPENLGKIDLRLVSNSDGMKIVMTAEIPATAKLLESHMDQLQQQLSNAGVSISGMSVNSQGAQGQFTNQSLAQSQTGATRPNNPAFQQDSETATPQVVKVSTSSLDYRV